MDAGKPNQEDRLVAQFNAIILSRLEEDKLAIPALPTSIKEALDLVRQNEFDLTKVGVVIEKEPMLAAAVLRLANSAAYAASGTVTSLKNAVSRLGMRALRTLVVEVGAEKMFVSRDKRIASETQKVWKHSLAVALVARDLRSFSGQADHDEAYLAGLLHDIGKPIVAGMLLSAEKQLAEGYSGKWIGSDLWTKVLHGSHRKVGVALAQKWQLPEAVSGAIHGSSDLDPANRGSLANTVCFANAVAKSCGISTRDDKEEASAMLMVGKSLLGLDDDLIAKLVKSLESRMAA